MLQIVPEDRISAKPDVGCRLRAAFREEVRRRVGSGDFAARENVALSLANELVCADLTGALEDLVESHGDGVCMSPLESVALADSLAVLRPRLDGVALARAIVPRPSVVLMDEPFSGLDVQLRDSMQEETLSLLRETRATCMIVTHHPEEAMRMSDRIAVMRRGRIVQLGRAEELYHHPAELFVARMFSEINELEVTVKNGGIDMPFGHVAAAGIADGEQAMMCIRERGIRLHPAGRCGLAGRVLHVKFLGDVGLVEIGVHGFDEPLRARTRVAVGEVWSKGAEVGVEIDPARILVFPKQVHEHK